MNARNLYAQTIIACIVGLSVTHAQAQSRSAQLGQRRAAVVDDRTCTQLGRELFYRIEEEVFDTLDLAASLEAHLEADFEVLNQLLALEGTGFAPWLIVYTVDHEPELLANTIGDIRSSYTLIEQSTANWTSIIDEYVSLFPECIRRNAMSDPPKLPPPPPVIISFEEPIEPVIDPVPYFLQDSKYYQVYLLLKELAKLRKKLDEAKDDLMRARNENPPPVIWPPAEGTNDSNPHQEFQDAIDEIQDTIDEVVDVLADLGVNVPN